MASTFDIGRSQTVLGGGGGCTVSLSGPWTIWSALGPAYGLLYDQPMASIMTSSQRNLSKFLAEPKTNSLPNYFFTIA